MSTPLISVRSLSKSFAGPAGRPLPVLDDISLDVAEGEFVALLGRSGSGKSTLLRCIAGLIAPTEGGVLFRGERLTGSNTETTMVFQTFALLPWLTVQQNVELGLEARGVPPAQRTERALRAIDIVGLDGYESAYPKELSGGMRQRVGFARALVVEPAALLMDEPFSALDVLTSENLRGELLELWEGQRFPTKTIVMVTHNIEEAVLLADRILVLGTNPGRIRTDMRNPLPRPRRRRTPEFEDLVDQIYRMMTQRDAAPERAPAGRGGGRGTISDTPLPPATVDGLSGLAEVMLGRHGGAADLADLADSLGLEVDDLLPLVDSLVLLGFAGLGGDRLALTAAGRVFAGASIQDSKEIFARAGLDRAPLVRTIYRALRGSLDGTLPAGFFTDILRTSFGEEDSARQFDTAVNWGRYAELYAFDAARGQVIREEQGIGATLADSAEPARHGTLTVFLGAAPGSGKTFTMLREGRALRSQGADVVIGAVRTHGRPRTQEAIGGLETVPPATGSLMDTAAVLARRPAIALVDDLGANAAGVDALRAAGIDVISTADVADVARLAGAITQITGRLAAATVTDQLLEGADEVQFVDSSPEALRKRLGHGNIYPGGEAPPELAATFHPASLAALRELGLRVVADTLPAPGPGRGREPQDVLVAVTGPDRAAELVRHGVRLARRGGAACSVLLLSPARQPAGPVGAVTQGAAAARHAQRRADAAGAARQAAADADAQVLERDGDAATVIPQAVRQSGARHLVIAAQPPGVLDRLREGALGRLRGSAVERLLAQLPDVHLHLLPPPGEEGTPVPAAPAPGQAAPPRGTVRVYLGYARGCGTTTAMLEEAVRRRSRGTDVIVAAVGGRDREGVGALLDELETIGDGDHLDVAAVLARRPEVACADDITADGRLAAVRRLAGAGITVIATAHLGGETAHLEAEHLEAEHLEAEHPAAEHPAAEHPAAEHLDGEAPLLALADELELVDVAPSALIERVRRGEIVPADRVPVALAGEYGPAALAQRREEAFRLVAEHADRRLAAYRHDGAADRPAILACVAPLPGMESLIRRSAALAAQVDGEFQAAMVLPAPPAPAEADGQVAGYAALVTGLGGELAVLAGPDPAAALADWARAHGSTEMVLARADGTSRYPVLRELAARPANLELHILPAIGEKG